MHGRSRLVFLAVALGAMLYTIDPVYRVRMRVNYHDPIELDPIIIATYTVVGASGIIVLATGHRWRRIPVPVLAAFAAFSAWCVLSTAWSIDAGETARQSLFMAGTFAAGAAAAVVTPLRHLTWAVWAGLHGPLVWSAFLIAISGTDAFDENGDASGAFFSRNILGMYAALAVLLGVLLLLDVTRRPQQPQSSWWLEAAAILVGGLAMDVWLLARTSSVTPPVALLVVVLALVLVGLTRRFLARQASSRSAPAPDRLVARTVTAGGVATLAIATVAWLTRGWWVDRLGRESDLTGRSDIWDTVLDWVVERPVHGHGYLGTWASRARAIEAQEAASLSHPVAHAHNSFLEALLGGGAVGLVAFMGLIALTYAAVTRFAISTRCVLTMVPFAVFVYVVAENLAETFVVGNHLNVALLAAVATTASATDSGEGPRARTSSINRAQLIGQ